MTLDPERRAEILAWAIEWVREKEDTFRSLSKKDPCHEGEFLWSQLHAPTGKCNSAALRTKIKEAETDAEIFDNLCSVGAERVRYARDSVLPLHLRFFLADVLIGRRKRPAERPGPPTPDRYREYWIFALVALLVYDFGLHATRNDETENSDSACDIAAEALRSAGLRPSSYGRVKKAWQSNKKRFEQILSGG